MTVDPFEHMEEAWGLLQNPFPPEGIRRTDDPYSEEVFRSETDQFRRKLVRGAILGRRGIGFLWSSGRTADTGFGKTTLMMETARAINKDLGRQVLLAAGMPEQRIVPIAAAYANLNTLDKTGLYPVLFEAAVDAATTRGRDTEALFDKLRERIGSDPSTVEPALLSARTRIAPGAAPLRPELVSAFATDGAAGVLRQLSLVSPTARLRNGLQYLDFLLTACAAAEVEHVFVFVDQLEDLANNKSVTSSKRSREIGRIRDLMEADPYASRLHLVFTFHNTAAQVLERFWETNRLPSFENSASNASSVVDLRGIEEADQVKALLGVYLDDARVRPDPSGEDITPFEPESLTVLLEVSEGRVGVLLSRAHELINAAAEAGRPTITGQFAREHFGEAAGAAPRAISEEPPSTDDVDELLSG
jgi:hypothetical protein